VALEAAARGIPVVCNRIGGLVEILGDHAFYAADHTYSAFRAAMNNWLTADNNTLEEMVSGALGRYYENFTDVHMAQRYMNLFESLR